MKHVSKYLVSLVVAISFAASVAFGSTEDFDNLFNRANDDRSQYSASEIQSQNKTLFEELKKSPYENNFPGFAKSVTREEATQILRAVISHPVAGLHMLHKYDPSQSMGFCFGRAMTVHLESIHSGVSQESIRKLWAFGDLRTGSNMWRYHVTSMLRGPGKTWWALDPIFGYVMTAEEWHKAMQAYDYDGGMKLYQTAAFKFGPSTGKYHNWQLLHEGYNQYFADLIQFYKDNGFKSQSGLSLRKDR